MKTQYERILNAYKIDSMAKNDILNIMARYSKQHIKTYYMYA